eukprot:TRINITY_DN30859_c0_g1_i1.p2 TRINITY_DN30859_c0_g1~~TRINITY_DN30859_c0_g1_i1.p2  ORF type:complete len:235 (+),score=74.85 TRINITY_DN30859_c0_g1_i1:57-761(+)
MGCTESKDQQQQKRAAQAEPRAAAESGPAEPKVVFDDASTESFIAAMAKGDRGAADCCTDDLVKAVPKGLLVAVEHRHLEVVQLLLQKGADVAARDEQGQTALHIAAAAGNEDMCTELIVHGKADVAATVEGRKDAAIHLAARGGRTDTVKRLLQEGASANALGDKGQTALHVAGLEAYYEMALELLQRGADKNIADEVGMRAEDYAYGNNHEATALLIEKWGEDDDEVSDAIV